MGLLPREEPARMFPALLFSKRVEGLGESSASLGASWSLYSTAKEAERCTKEKTTLHDLGFHLFIFLWADWSPGRWTGGLHEKKLLMGEKLSVERK